MRKLITFVMLCLWVQLSCRQTEDINPGLPGEVKATIVGYTSPLEKLISICAESWKVDIEGKPFKSRVVPAAFQQENTAVWIKYKTDTIANSTQCGFVKFISIRKR